MDEWQKAKFADWASRFCYHLIARLPAQEQQRIIKRLERGLPDYQQKSEGK